MSIRLRLIILVVLFVIDGFLLQTWFEKRKVVPENLGPYPETQQLSQGEWTFDKLSQFFSALAVDKGAVYAFQLLKVAPLPPNIDTHLLGHEVGDILYKQQGAQGIKYCTNDFRNACSHSIVVGLFLAKGESALSEITQACSQAPGGKGAYTMCFHGLGHGILAYTGYKLEKTIELCKLTGTEQYQNQEIGQCISGAIMELISGGFHNRKLWEVQAPKYFRTADPLYPCDNSLIPVDSKPLCYVYLTPHLMAAAGSPITSPDPITFAKAFSFCNKIPVGDGANRWSCYGGFGKEFVVLAQSHDIRNITDITPAEMELVSSWCLQAPHSEAINACEEQVVQSLYWGGENSYQAAINYCQIVKDPYQSSCFVNLINAVKYFAPDANYVNEFCQKLPSSFAQQCSSS